MIYDFPEESVPLKQGDIFYPLPIAILDDPGNFIVLSEDGIATHESWENMKDETNKSAILPFKRVWGIIATQGCDALRIPFISFFLIDKFLGVSRISEPSTPKKWVSTITQRSRLNLRWFYLPNNEQFGFSERMAINFNRIFQVSRDFLVQNLDLRKGRLNDVAYQHYREHMAQYFRRYPYDEWYSLNKEEFEKYKEDKERVSGVVVKPFKWQE